jgi:predicted HicB family RNase H-like nuclease
MASARKQVVTYVDPMTHEWLTAQAKEQHRSLSQFLSLMLKRLAEDERGKVEGPSGG